jgi:hypothetical protein
MNHLEQLVGEWLQYNKYFVRVSVQVGPRPRGGFAGELDVVGINLAKHHLIHVECSLNALSDAQRQRRFALKFERGRKYIRDVFEGIRLPEKLDQIAILQFTSGKIRSVGGARVVTVRELIHEINKGLQETSPSRKAVTSNLPLLRTLQMAADAAKNGPLSEHQLLPPAPSHNS